MQTLLGDTKSYRNDSPSQFCRSVGFRVSTALRMFSFACGILNLGNTPATVGEVYLIQHNVVRTAE
jgi:hypothetical protein